MNKKGVVIGKTITTMVTLIAVSIIAALFLTLASLTALLKKPEINQFENEIQTKNLLFKKISMFDPKKPKEKLDVLSAITELGVINKKLTPSEHIKSLSRDEIISLDERTKEIKDALIQMINQIAPEKTCFFVIREVPESPIGPIIVNIWKIEGKTFERQSTGKAINYFNEGHFVEIPELSTEMHEIKTNLKLNAYYGPCQDD